MVDISRLNHPNAMSSQVGPWFVSSPGSDPHQEELTLQLLTAILLYETDWNISPSLVADVYSHLK